MKKNFEIAQGNLVNEKKNKITSDFEFIKEIGSGAFSKVYKVRDKKTNILRCVKKLNKKDFTDEERKKLVDEVKIWKELDHPHILNVIAFYQNDKYFFIVTEHLDGGELFDKIIEEQHFTEKKASEYMSQILSAVNYLHSHGITHRDLKPENIIFESKSENSNLKIIDFGTSCYFDPTKKLKHKLGTPYYIAPEVLKKNYDYKCDIWSCGIIIYIFLCGYPPFNGPNDREIFKRILAGKFTFPNEEWASVSNEAKDIIKKMLTYDSSKRPNAEECFKHEFFKSNKNTNLTNKSKIILNNFKKFKSQFKFEKAMTLLSIKMFDLKKEKENLLKTFKTLDENDDGQLSIEEVRKGYTKLGIDTNEKEILEIFNQLDVNKTGFLDFTEFVMAAVNKKCLFEKKNIKVLFDIIDTDKSGTISHKELKDFFNFDKEEDKDELDDFIETMIKEVDKNNDGEISYKEFEEMLVNHIN